MLGEQIKVREASEAEVHGLRLKPDNRNYAGPTFGAFLKSIQESNSCLKVSALDPRRRNIEVWTEGAITCPAPDGATRVFACDLRNCQ